eukprot:CAMPEP_0175031148 /NCGR_PEP_ID=MMETSP0005-20121125/20642_1 /TAXON_ID=420556 /ORGANISM="Ochromonas sp., Strain CCMP1393" /LENGTH=268 /DNA_ID=CAMNT_0016291341 /DNA_START=21 /DNA_END=827 /DNA_ORIENTATION=+
MMRYMRTRMYCNRTKKPVTVRIDVHDPSVGHGLAMKHKKILREEIENFDLFVYYEDDVIFTHLHLVAYLAETKKLHELGGLESGLRERIIGFQRFRRMKNPYDVITKKHFGNATGYRQDVFEELPEFRHVCINDHPYIEVKGNTHQALWIFTSDNLRWLQHKCNFMDHEMPSREIMSSFLLYNRQREYCWMNKLLPAERMQSLAIRHYYEQRHVNWNSLFLGNENFKSGYEPYYHEEVNPKIPMEKIPKCWDDIVQKYRGFLNNDIKQ